MEKLSPKELSSLLRKPQGEVGLVVGEEMNKSNEIMYDLVFSVTEFGDHENVLEIGFGNGVFFPKYLEYNTNLKLHGLDYSELMCEEAAKRNEKLIEKGVLQITHGNASSMSFPERQFDKVIALNTVYFWEPLEDHFLEIKRILKPGGVFYLGFRPKHAVEHFEFTKYGFNLYEAESLKKVALNCGFDIHDEKQITYEKSAPDGQQFRATDICLAFISA